MKPPYWIGDNVYRIFPENSMYSFQYSSLRSCQNKRYDCHMNKTYEGNRSRLTTILYVRLGIASLLYKGMYMKCIGKGNQEIEYDHVVTVSCKSERKQHERIYRDAVWGEGYRNISDWSGKVTDITFPVSDYELSDLSEKQ